MEVITTDMETSTQRQQPEAQSPGSNGGSPYSSPPCSPSYAPDSPYSSPHRSPACSPACSPSYAPKSPSYLNDNCDYEPPQLSHLDAIERVMSRWNRTDMTKERLPEWMTQMFKQLSFDETALENNEMGHIASVMFLGNESNPSWGTPAMRKPGAYMTITILLSDTLSGSQKKYIWDFMDQNVAFAHPVQSDDDADEEDEESEDDDEEEVAKTDEDNEHASAIRRVQQINRRTAKEFNLRFVKTSFEYMDKFLDQTGTVSQNDSSSKTTVVPPPIWVSSYCDPSVGRLDYFTYGNTDSVLEEETMLHILRLEAHIMTELGIKRHQFALDHTILRVAHHTRRYCSAAMSNLLNVPSELEPASKSSSSSKTKKAASAKKRCVPHNILYHQ